MIDREKVKKELLELNAKAYGLWVHDQKNEFLAQIGNVTDDVLALLKEQEAVKPILTPWIVNDDGEVNVYKMECGKCGIQFYYEDQKYCSECGTPILWEGR